MDFKIRKLTVSDNRILIRLIKKLISETKETWIENIIHVSDGKKSVKDDEETGKQYLKVFSSIIISLIEKFESDITDWFASLISVTPDEYKNLDFDTDIKIVDQIKNAKEFNDFFQNACAVFNVKSVSQKVTKLLKEKLDSLTTSLTKE